MVCFIHGIVLQLRHSLPDGWMVITTRVLFHFFSATLLCIQPVMNYKDPLDTEAKARYEKKLDFEPALTSLVWKPGLTMSPCGRQLCCNSGILQESTLMRNSMPATVLRCKWLGWYMLLS